VVLGTLLFFGVAVVVVHSVALTRATGPLRLQSLRLMADAAVRDQEEGRPMLADAPFQATIIARDGTRLEGRPLPAPFRWHGTAHRPGEYCGPLSAFCYAIRALPGRTDGARLVVVPTHRPRPRHDLWSPATAVFLTCIGLWIASAAAAGRVLLGSLRRGEEARRRLLAGLAHDLGTPLTSIRGFAETLLAAPNASEADRRGWTVVYREALRMQRLVEDMMTLTRLESGVLPLVPRPFDLRESLEAAAERARLAHGLAPRLELPDEPAPAVLDRDRIDQVLANVVDNAYRHGGGREVTLRLSSPVRGRWRVEVADAGPGLSAEARARLFEPFSPSERGNGLGLAIAREIVQRHGGRLEVSPGPGCRVVLDLPAEAR
jgi:signal transduction histidine kinase